MLSLEKRLCCINITCERGALGCVSGGALIITPEPSKCFLELLRAAAAAAVAGKGTGEEMTLRPALILRACMTPLVSIW